LAPSSARRRSVGDAGRQPIGLDDPVEDLLHHREVVLADVGQRELRLAELRHADDVGHQLLGEADAAGADDGDLQS